MILKEFKTLFTDKLSELYPQTEIDSLFFLLIEEYLGFERIDTVLKSAFEISQEQFNQLESATIRLQKEEPIQYILGKTEFYGLPFFVNEHVLIPRPETEELVEWIIKKVTSTSLSDQNNILDIGTGSGCIPITLKKKLSKANITSIDVSEIAIEVAIKNAELNNVEINFIHQDILNTNELHQKFDVIISNPPYVRELEKEEIKNNVLENEPHLALFVEDHNPLLFYDKIADLAKEFLLENGLLFFEINQYLGKETLELLQVKGFKNIELKKDLFGNDRMILAHK
tara:strand:- start:95942 stop:96796 length:855 start_codon:yes stop_codon:yes gene_type:complete